MRQPRYDLSPPALLGLPLQNVTTNLPVKQYQFAVDGLRRPLLGAMDTLL